jgi:hypothetical protein
MKKAIIFLGTILLILLISCEKDFLVKLPPDKLPAKGFFNSADRALSGVNAIYISLASGYLHGGDDNGMRLFDPPAGDAVLGAGISAQVFNNFAYSAADDALQMFYSGCYEGIFRANLVIRDVPEISMDETLKARYLGEAKFLRALYYWYLTTMFGEVPLFLEPVELPEEALIEKSSVAEIYEIMISDLQAAIQSLPVVTSYGSADKGRASKGAAQALLGKVYLYAKNYTLAESLLGQVINSNNYGLMANFDEVWNRNFENNKESIFEVQFGSGLSGATYPVGNTDKHYWVQISGGLGEFVPTKSLVDAFEPNDPRLNLSIFNYEGQPFAPNLTTAQTNLDVFKKSWSSTGYGVRKGMVPMLLPLGIDANGTNLPLIRYADVLLMYAEAANELGMLNAARDAVNQVRQRPSVNMAVLTEANSGTKATMFDAIVRERRVELAFERHRFNDLKRWGLATQELANIGYNESLHRYFPLPQLEVDINKKLVQLSGW